MTVTDLDLGLFGHLSDPSGGSPRAATRQAILVTSSRGTWRCGREGVEISLRAAHVSKAGFETRGVWDLLSGKWAQYMNKSPLKSCKLFWVEWMSCS